MNRSFSFQIILLIAGLMVAACASQAELMVGDPAPKLQTGQWIQGDAAPVFDTNHVYVVEFWATWCGPCVSSIPHLNQLWQKYKDKGVVIIGQDVWDSDEAVAPFVKKMGTNMTYRVALDDKSQDPDGFMAAHWWKRGVAHHGIPNAFIINQDGIIAWIGHPMTLKEQVLDEIIFGHYDLTRAVADYRKDFELNQRFQDLQGKLNSAVRQKKWDDAQVALNEIFDARPQMTNSFVTPRLQILLGRKKFGEAYGFADTFSRIRGTNDYWQNELAWTIAASDGPDKQCLGLAESLAVRAVEFTQGTNSASLDTLARAQFMLGKKSEAIATEEKAVNLAKGQREESGLKKTLASYREGKLPTANE